MAMQNATAKKIANFKALIGNNIYTYDDLMSLMEGRKDLPSWTILVMRCCGMAGMSGTPKTTSGLLTTTSIFTGWCKPAFYFIEPMLNLC